MLISKFLSESVLNIAYSLIPSIIQIDYITLIFILNNLVSRLFVSLLGFLNSFCYNYFNLHPFFFYGILNLIMFFASFFFEEIKSAKYEIISISNNSDNSIELSQIK